MCLGGEIGRHDGFKIRWLHGRAGSSPALGTIKLFIKMADINQKGKIYGFSTNKWWQKFSRFC